MKQLELKPTKSRMAPNMIGSRKPPRPPARPTIPVTTPMFSGKSSPMNVKLDAMAQAKQMPSVDGSSVKNQLSSAIVQFSGSRLVRIVNTGVGQEVSNRQTDATHSTHHVTLCAPNRSESQPPSARKSPAGRAKQVARSDACAIESPYSDLKYCGIQIDSAVKP